MRKLTKPCQFIQPNPGKCTAIIACFVFLISLFQVNHIQAQSSTQAVILPSSVSIPVGETTTVNLNLIAGVDINAFDVEISYDPAIVALDSWSTGSYLSNLAKVYETNVPGSLRLVFTQLATAGVNGDGPLLSFTFTGVSAGSSQIAVESIQLSNSSAESVPVSANDGEIIVQASAVHTSTSTVTAPAPATSTHTPTITPTQTSTPTRTATVTPVRTSTPPPMHSRTPTRTSVPATRVASKTPAIRSTNTRTPAPALTIQTTNTQAAILTLAVQPTDLTATAVPSTVQGSENFTETAMTTPTAALVTAVSPWYEKIWPEGSSWQSQLPCCLSFLLLLLLIILIIVLLTPTKKEKKS